VAPWDVSMTMDSKRKAKRKPWVTGRGVGAARKRLAPNSLKQGIMGKKKMYYHVTTISRGKKIGETQLEKGARPLITQVWNIN